MKLARDFPYYAGHPVSIGPWGWLALLLSNVVAFLALVLLPASPFLAQLLSRMLFAGIPLCTLVWVAGRHAKALFAPIGTRDAVVALLAAVLSILLAFVAALVVRQFATVAPNAQVLDMGRMGFFGLLLNLLSTAPQLLGEELLTIFPFLALLHLATVRWGFGRRAGIAVALIGSTLVFSAAHLPTYDWNWAQCFGVIGASRVVLTVAYVLTRNLWVSTAAHVLNDWTEFTVAFVAMHSAHHPAP